MADEIALDLEELREIQSVAKRPRTVSLINSEITNLEKESTMVTTRSMSRSKSGATKTVKPPKVVETNSTRRKSGTAKTKTVKPPNVVERNSTRRKSGTAKTKTVKPPNVVESWRNPIRCEALSIFMIKEYLRPYYEKNPPHPTQLVPKEVIRSGHVKWFYMSDGEKAPWIELAKKMKAEGISVYYMRCHMVY